MQASVWRPTSSPSTSRASVVEQHDVEAPAARRQASPRSRASCTGSCARPVDERGRSWRNTSRSSGVGTSFSIPTTVIRVSGRVVQNRPLPSDSTTQTLPVSATAKLAPLIATRARRNFARRCAPGSRGELLRIVGEIGQPERAAEEVADLDPVLVDRRDEDVRRLLAGQLADQLGQVGLDDVDPGGRERLVELDLVGGQRLDLHDLARAGRRARCACHDRARLGGVARPVHRCRPRARPPPRTASEVLVEVPQDAALDRAPASRSASQSGSSATARARLSRIVRVALPRLRRSCVSCSASLRGGGEAGRHAAARMSARCAVRTPERSRDSAPPMCMRHELSAAVQHLGPRVEDAAHLVGKHRRRRVGVLDREGAAEAAALRRVGKLDELEPAHSAKEAVGRVADLKRAQRVTGGVVGHTVRKGSADVLDTEPCQPGTR